MLAFEEHRKAVVELLARARVHDGAPVHLPRLWLRFRAGLALSLTVHLDDLAPHIERVRA